MLRPTVPPDDPPAGPDAPPDDADEGRGDEPPAEAKAKAPKPRKKRAAAGKSTPRRYTIPDAIHERVELHAIKQKKTASAVVTEILRRNLPEYVIRLADPDDD